MRSRSSRGSISSIYSPVNEASVTVARSEPEPLTHKIRVERPRKSTSSALADVLPPPQLQIERSAPTLRDTATSCASTINTETFAITANPFIDQLIAQSEGLSRRGGGGADVGGGPLWPPALACRSLPNGRPQG